MSSYFPGFVAVCFCHRPFDSLAGNAFLSSHRGIPRSTTMIHCQGVGGGGKEEEEEEQQEEEVEKAEDWWKTEFS